jgi:hypothetical protein
MESSLDSLPRFDSYLEHFIQMQESNEVHVLFAGVRGTLGVDCATTGAHALIVRGFPKPWSWRLNPGIVCGEIFDLVEHVF